MSLAWRRGLEKNPLFGDAEPALRGAALFFGGPEESFRASAGFDPLLFFMP
jgi:hypothetical protein